MQPVDQHGIGKISIAIERDRHIGIGIGENEARKQREGETIGEEHRRVCLRAQAIQISDERG